MTQRMRKYLRPILKHLVVAIEGGPNKGLLVSRACGPSYQQGTYEGARWVPLSLMIEPGDVFWDVGAHYGYVALFAHRAVGDAGRVYAFEPSRRNRSFLARHVRANRPSNVEVLPYALSDFVGTSNFGGGTGSGTRRLGAGHGRVPVQTVDALVASGTCLPPTWIKLDVEGGEVAILRGAESVLRGQPIAALVETHSPELHAECLQILEGYGYTCHVPTQAHDVAPHDVRAEILALGPGRSVPEGPLAAFLASPIRS